jgi:PEGA domain
MRKILIAPTLALLLVAIAAVPSVADDPPQHRKSSEPTAQEPAQPRPAPQATPRERPRRPDRGPIVVRPGWPWWGYPYPYGYPPGPWRVYTEWETANVRIDVTPEDAQVYVDRYFAGVADDYDGIFQRLTLRPGSHLIEIRKSGYTTLVFEVNLYPGQTVTYRRAMEPSKERATGESLAVAPGFDEGAAPPPVDANGPAGEVRFDVTPKDAAIFADGFYAGLVSDFNGSQHLMLAPGRHYLTLELDGYMVADVEISLEPAQTITYRASLKKLP